MLDVVDGLQVHHWAYSFDQEQDPYFESIDLEDDNREQNWSNETQDSKVGVDGLLFLDFLHLIHTLEGPYYGPLDELVNCNILLGTGGVLGRGDFPVVPVQVLISEVHVQVFQHMDGPQVLVESSRLVEYLVGDCELHCVKVRVNENEGQGVEDRSVIELHAPEYVQGFEE